MFNLKNKLNSKKSGEFEEKIPYKEFKSYDQGEFWSNPTYQTKDINENIFDYSQNH